MDDVIKIQMVVDSEFKHAVGAYQRHLAMTPANANL
jgi:hypothetical protein